MDEFNIYNLWCRWIARSSQIVLVNIVSVRQIINYIFRISVILKFFWLTEGVWYSYVYAIQK